MRLPRDISGEELARGLRVLGYRVVRQTSSHLRLTTDEQGEHHLTIPTHRSLRVGTLSGVVADVAHHFGLSREEVLRRLFR